MSSKYGAPHYPNRLRKAKTFLTDEYLKEIEANSDQRYFFLRAKCYHSFKKSEAPHVFRFALCIVSVQAKSSKPTVHAKLVK